MKKTYISAAQLLRDSFELALLVLHSGWLPTIVVGVWRGGTPVGIAVQEALAFAGCKTTHMPIRVTSYIGIGSQGKIEVEGLGALVRRTGPGCRILLVDDVHDSGQSIARVADELVLACGVHMPELRVAVPWFKPAHNTTSRIPDYYLHETADWLVFPHELCGLADAEVGHKPDLDGLARRLLDYRDKFATPGS